MVTVYHLNNSTVDFQNYFRYNLEHFLVLDWTSLIFLIDKNIRGPFIERELNI
jgi:hypothetical protein